MLGEPLEIDAFKLPHHGSAKNVSNDLLAVLSCKDYLISTNGDQFHHPDHKALARIINSGGDRPRLFFNYRSEENGVWNDAGLRERHGYETLYPEQEDGGIVYEP